MPTGQARCTLAGMTDEERTVRSDSDELLAAIDDMRRTEQVKREEEISTPAFHDLANAVEDKARRVWEISARENVDGDAADTTDATINDTPVKRGT